MTEKNIGNQTAQVIEDTYLALQERITKYRRERDGVNAPGDIDDPLLYLQDGVLTCYELLRPHLTAPKMAKYREGALAEHPEESMPEAEAKEYYFRNSCGVWQAQTHIEALTADHLQQAGIRASGSDQPALADGSGLTAADWHDALDRPDTSRIVSVAHDPSDPDYQFYFKELRFAVLGLRELPDWQVTERVEREHGDGFMAGEVGTRTFKEAEPQEKVETAARMLVDAAHDLGVTPKFDETRPVRDTPTVDEEQPW